MVYRLVRIVLVLTFIVLIPIAAILLFEPKLDLTPYRDSIARQLSEATGRNVRLSGDIHLALGRQTQVAIHDLSIANPAWAESDRLVRAAEISVGIDLVALLSGVVHISYLRLRDADASLEVASNGEQSWDLGSQPEPPGPEITVDHSGPSGIRLIVERVAIEKVTLVYREAQREPFKLRVDHLSQHDDAGTLLLKAAARANELDVRLDGRIGTLQSLLAGRDIDIDLRAELDETTITLRGHLGDPVRLEDIELESTLNGPSLARLLNRLGIAYTQDGDIELALRITDLAQGFAWQSTGRVGPLNLDSHGRLEKPLELDDLELAIDINGSDLSALGKIVGIEALPAQPYRLNGRVQRDESGLELHDIALETGKTRMKLTGTLPLFPSFDKGSTRLEVEVPEPGILTSLVGTELKNIGPLFARARLDALENGEEVLDAEFSLGENRLTLTGPLGSYPEFRTTKLAFELTGPNLAKLARTLGVNDLPFDSYRLAGKVEVTDDGRLMLRVTEGRLDDVGLVAEGSFGRLPQLLDTGFVGSRLTLGVSLADLSAIIPSAGRYHPPKAAFLGKVSLSLGKKHLEIESLAAETGEARLTGKGRVALDDWKQGAEMQLTLHGPLLTDLGSVDGIDLPAQPFEFGALLKRSPKGFEASNLRARVGQGEMSGRVRLDQGPRPNLDLVATIREFDFRPYVVSHQEEVITKEPVSSVENDKKIATARLIPDEPPPLAFLDRFDGRFRVEGRALVFPDPVFPKNVLVREIDIEAKLEAGSLSLKKLRLSGDRGALSGHGELKRTAEGLATELSMKAHDFRFGILAMGTGLERLPAHELDVRLVSSGRTARQLAAALNGTVRLVGGAGETVNAGLDKALGSFLNELLVSVNPFAKTEPRTRVECTAAAVDIVDGKVKLDPGFVIRTDKIDISAYGSVDLRSEKIELKFKNSPRKGIGLSATGLVKPYVKVGGSLAKPALTLDAPSALLSGTAAVATGGLSILVTGLFDRISTAANPCEAAIRQADSGKAPSTVKSQDAR